MSESEPHVFVLADRALESVVARIPADRWSMQMPPQFQRSDTEQVPTLREIVNYHAYDDAWVPDMLAGFTMADVGEEAYAGDLLGDDPVAAFHAVVDKACTAAEAVVDLDRTVHCSYGDFTTREYFQQITMFRGLRAHDIALAVGIEPQLSDELVQGLWDEVSPHADEWRTYGVFPPAVPVPDDAPLLDRLLGLTGRDPAWKG